MPTWPRLPIITPPPFSLVTGDGRAPSPQCQSPVRSKNHGSVLLFFLAENPSPPPASRATISIFLCRADQVFQNLSAKADFTAAGFSLLLWAKLLFSAQNPPPISLTRMFVMSLRKGPQRPFFLSQALLYVSCDPRPSSVLSFPSPPMREQRHSKNHLPSASPSANPCGLWSQVVAVIRRHKGETSTCGCSHQCVLFSWSIATASSFLGPNGD